MRELFNREIHEIHEQGGRNSTQRRGVIKSGMEKRISGFFGTRLGQSPSRSTSETEMPSNHLWSSGVTRPSDPLRLVPLRGTQPRSVEWGVPHPLLIAPKTGGGQEKGLANLW